MTAAASHGRISSALVRRMKGRPRPAVVHHPLDASWVDLDHCLDGHDAARLVVGARVGLTIQPIPLHPSLHPLVAPRAIRRLGAHRARDAQDQRGAAAEVQLLHLGRKDAP